ncbi:hypothetical protein HK405_011110, partial [Cladochytrium tenue]
IGGLRSTYTSKITDEHSEVRTRSTHLVITSFLPLPAPTLHLDPWGQFRPDLFASFPNAVGFFRFRRNSTLCLSLKETAMYESMRALSAAAATRTVPPPSPRLLLRSSAAAAATPAVAPDAVVAAIFTTNANEESTLNIDFAFFRQRQGSDSEFERVPVVVSNLVESSQATPGGAAAFLSSMSPGARPTSWLETGFQNLSLKHLLDYERLYKGCMTELHTAVRDLATSETELNSLRQQLARRDQTRGAAAAAAAAGTHPPAGG